MKDKKVNVIIFTSIFIVSLLFFILTGVYIHSAKNIVTPQENYAKYLVDLNNQFVRQMYDFLQDIGSVDSMEESTERDKILKRAGEYITVQNSLVDDIIENSPNASNQDYFDLVDQMRYTYLFMLQGEIDILEQMYEADAEKREPTKLQTGYAMQNVMGEIILQFPDVINKVRDTDYKADYIYVPDENSIILEGVKTEEEYKKYLEQSMNEYDGESSIENNIEIPEVEEEYNGNTQVSTNGS